jgi:hypothetical protein
MKQPYNLKQLVMKKQKEKEVSIIENTSKQIYESPVINFVPLKPEERLLACDKTTYNACGDEGAAS